MSGLVRRRAPTVVRKRAAMDDKDSSNRASYKTPVVAVHAHTRIHTAKRERMRVCDRQAGREAVRADSNL